MNETALFLASRPVTLVGGGPCSARALARARSRAPVIVAADGGADRALALGIEPEMVIGDLDSISDTARVRLGPARLRAVAEQESTDFDKCLRSIAAPFVLAVGFEGNRMDHALAAFNTLARAPGPPCLMLGGHDVAFRAPAGPLELALAPGTRVSLFPMAPVEGRSQGLRWPIDGLRLAPAGRIGTSNEAVAEVVRLEFTTPGMLVMLPPEALDAAL
ncbi:MAG: thiamine diphosphokinase, partial [Rhodobacteraceae bacterium]|nr:thiamine diphosphokinase [Paracoccaceae bacterium]